MTEFDRLLKDYADHVLKPRHKGVDALVDRFKIRLQNESAQGARHMGSVSTEAESSPTGVDTAAEEIATKPATAGSARSDDDCGGYEAAETELVSPESVDDRQPDRRPLSHDINQPWRQPWKR